MNNKRAQLLQRAVRVLLYAVNLNDLIATRLKITWVQQRQHHRAEESARERMLSLLNDVK